MELYPPDQVAYENLKNNRATETTITDASTEYQDLGAGPPEIRKEYQGLVTDSHISVQLTVPEPEKAYENSMLQGKSPNNSRKGQSLYEEVKTKT